MFDIHQAFGDEDGDWDEGDVEDYCYDLTDIFVDSPEGSAAVEYYGRADWVHTFLYYGLCHVGVAPPAMSRGDVAEILFDLFPEKVSTEPESAPEIIGVLRAFWEFLQRQYELANAADILKLLADRAEERLRRELDDPRNFGMAKSMVMMGQAAGFDMTTREGIEQFMSSYNASLARRRADEAEPDYDDVEPWPESPDRPKLAMPHLSATERKTREKLRRAKLDKRRRRR